MNGGVWGKTGIGGPSRRKHIWDRIRVGTAGTSWHFMDIIEP